MKKLTLELDALSVESFDTGAEAAGEGTVRGHDTRITEWCQSTYVGCKPTIGCVSRLTCAREDDEIPAAMGEPQLPPK
ncbi:hypothetical protein [Longimicrobium sp.]|uniref:hypothetical protein n=1 Tax=Longimicrobium sp. TaxID=2029185 RepID=UPI002CF13EB4|nr:hypothetical protein [Longimicrobium sp.]HSU16409.1 hypothetical protein [Longimicrobium sp.]